MVLVSFSKYLNPKEAFMHIYSHDINLDNLKDAEVKKLRYISFLNMTLPELELLAMFANTQPIPVPLKGAAQNLRNDINRTLADSIAVLNEANGVTPEVIPPSKTITE